MQLLEHDSFFKQLAALFEASKDKGSVWLTHKRLTRDDEGALTSPSSAGGDNEYPCLVRVTNGKDVSFSARIDSTQLNQFHATYGTLLKSSMTTELRKRDKKREKQRAEESIRRKRRLAEDIVVEGAKRGNGRRKRQRLLKRAIRQEETRKRVHEREEARLNKAKSPST